MKKKKKKDTEAPEAVDSTPTPPAEGKVEETPPQDSEPVTLSAEEYAALRAAAAEAEEWKTKYLYQTAELENVRKRAQRERSELITYAGQHVLYALLDVMDNFSRALEADRQETDPAVIVQGIEMIYGQLERLLSAHNVKPIEAKGVAFSPLCHEAIQHIPSPAHEPGTVMEELQRGYYYHDRILRPARVIVAAPPVEEVDTDRHDAVSTDTDEQETPSSS